ncbi:ATP5H family protein [Megaselia abdita]
MAARRITASTVNWASLAERVPANQKASFANFKSKSDSYLRAVMANPENPPKIDWAFYKKLVTPAMVDTFQQKYEALKVPYPADNVSASIDAQAKETKSEVDSFVKSSKDRISGYESEISHIKGLLPYEQMTLEDYRDAFPEKALDPINRPTFWPHTPEDQVGYKSKDAPVDH